MGTNDNLGHGTYTISFVTQMENTKNIAQELENQLSKVKMPQMDVTKLKNNFSDLYKQIDKITEISGKTKKTKVDLTNFENAKNKIISIFEKINTQTEKINDKSLEFNVKEPTELIEAKKHLQELQAELNKKTNTDIFDRINSGFKKLTDGAQSSSQTIKNLGTAINSGSLDEVKTKLGELTSRLLSFKTGGQQASNEVKARVKELQVAIKEMDDGKIQQLTQDFQNLSNQVSSGTDVKITNMAKAILEIASAEREVRSSEAIVQLAQQAKVAESDVQRLSTAFRDQLASGVTSSIQAMNQLRSSVTSLLIEQSKAEAEQVHFNQSLDQLKTRVTYFFGLANAAQLFRRAIQYTYNTVKELDKAMTQTAVVTSFDVGDMWQALPKYTSAANQLGVTVKGVYDTMTLFYQQGLQTNQVFEVGTETLKMARIAGLEYEEATKAMTAALRGFNMEISQASAQKVNDVYSKLAAITASDVGEIATAMEKTASIASNAGMELETTAAFLAQIIETTQEAPETAGTAMKTIIARFTEMKKAASDVVEVDGEMIDVNKVDAALRSVGVALKDTNGEFRNLGDVFLELSSKWNTLDKMSQRYIATMAAGSRQQSRFIAAMSNYDRTMELVEAAKNSGGAADTQFAKTMDSMDAKVNKLKNAWQSFLMGLANSTAIKTLVDALTGVINMFTKATTGTNGFVTAFSRISAVVTIFKALSAAARSLMAQMTQGQVTLKGWAEGFKQSFNTSAFDKMKAHLQKNNQEYKKSIDERVKYLTDGVNKTVQEEIRGFEEREAAENGLIDHTREVEQQRTQIVAEEAEKRADLERQRMTGTGATGAGVARAGFVGGSNKAPQMNTKKDINAKVSGDIVVNANNNMANNPLLLGQGSSGELIDPNKQPQNTSNQVLGVPARGESWGSQPQVMGSPPIKPKFQEYIDYANKHTGGIVELEVGDDGIAKPIQSQQPSQPQQQLPSGNQPLALPPKGQSSYFGQDTGGENDPGVSKLKTASNWIQQHAYAAGMALNLLGNGIQSLTVKAQESGQLSTKAASGLQGVGAGLSMMGSTMGILNSLFPGYGIAIAAVIGAITGAISAHSAYKQALEEEKNAAIEAAKAANENTQKNRDSYKTLEETVDDYQNGKASRSDVEEAAQPLIESYNLQNEEASLLCGTYDQLIERMRQLRLEEEQKTYEKNKEAQDKIDTAFGENTLSTNPFYDENGNYIVKSGKTFDWGFNFYDEDEIASAAFKNFTQTGTGYNIVRDADGKIRILFDDPSNLTPEQKRAAIKDLQTLQQIMKTEIESKGKKAENSEIYTNIGNFIDNFTEAVDQYEETASGAASAINSQAVLEGKTEGLNLDKIQSVDDYNKAVEAYTERLKTLTDKDGNPYSEENITKAVEQYFAQNGTTNIIQIAEKKLGESKAGLTLDDLAPEYQNIRYLQIIASIDPDDYDSEQALYDLIDQKELETRLNIVSTFQTVSGGILDKISNGEDIEENDIAAITTLLETIDDQTLKNKWAEAQNQGYLAMLETLEEIYAKTKEIQKESFYGDYDKATEKYLKSNPSGLDGTTESLEKYLKYKGYTDKDIEEMSSFIDYNNILKEYQEALVEEQNKFYSLLLSDANKNLKITSNTTQIGNIDYNNRKRLEWTEENVNKYRDAINSWAEEEEGDIADSYLGFYSTVDSIFSKYQGIDIAFTPMLQTENGAEFLDKNTVEDYINQVIDAARKGQSRTGEDLGTLILRFDNQGFVSEDGTQIEGKKIIAATGEDAKFVAKIGHYLGKDGSIQDLQNHIDNLQEKQQELVDRYSEAAKIYSESGNNIEEAFKKIEETNYHYEKKKALRQQVQLVADTKNYYSTVEKILNEKIEKQINITSADDLKIQAELLKGYKAIEKKINNIKKNGYKISGSDFADMVKIDPNIMGAVKNVDTNTGQVTFDAQKLKDLYGDINSKIKEMSNGLASSLNEYIQQLNNAESQWKKVADAAKPQGDKDSGYFVDEEEINKALDGIDSVTAQLILMQIQTEEGFGAISSSASAAGTAVVENANDMTESLNQTAKAASEVSKALAACANGTVYEPVEIATYGAKAKAGMTYEERQRRGLVSDEERQQHINDTVGKTSNDAFIEYLKVKSNPKATKDEIKAAQDKFSSAYATASAQGATNLYDPKKYINAERTDLTGIITTLDDDNDTTGKGGKGGGGGGGSDSKDEDGRSKEDIEKENAQARLNTLKSEEADIDRELNLLQKLPIRLYPLELAMQGRKLANLKKQITAQKEVVKQSEAELANLRKKNSQLDKYYTIEETKDDFGNTQRTFQYSDQYINASEEERKKADEGGLNDIKSAVDTTNTENDALSGLMGDFGGQALDMLNSGIDMAKQAIEKMVEVFSALVDWWTNREDWLYNLLSKIEQETRNFARLQQVEERFRLGSTEGVDELVAAWYAQKESLDKQIALEEELIASRKAELQFLNLTNLPFSPAFHYDYKEERVIENPWVYDIYKLVLKMGAIIPEIGGVFSSLESLMEDNKARMEKAVQDIEDAKDKILEIEKQQLELRQQYMDDEVSLEELVMGKIIEKMQEEIDSMTALSEAISEANSKLLETLQNNLEKMRQDRENANTEEELAKKERRLAYLRQDTSGANQVEIRKLEEELDKGHQDYTDKLIDQKITELQKQNDKAAAQREAQINLAQAQLDYTERYGLQWEEARELIKNGYDDQGRLRVGSELFDLLMSSEDFAGLGAGSTRQLSQRMEWDITGIAGATFRAINDVWNKGFLLNNPQSANVHKEEQKPDYKHLPQYLNFLQPAYEALQDYFVNWTGKNIEAFFHQLGDEDTSPLAGRKIIGWVKRAIADASRDTSNQSNRGNINYATTTTPDLFKANNYGNKTTQNTISNKTYQNNIVNYNNFNTNVGNNWDRAGIVTVMRDVLGEWADGFMSLLNPFDNSRSH